MMPFLLHLSVLLTLACVAGLWQGLAFVGLAWTLDKLMPRASAGLRSTLFIVTFAGAFASPWLGVQRLAEPGSSHGLQLSPWIAAVLGALWLAAFVYRAVQLCLAWRHLCAVRRNAQPIEVLGLAEFDAGSRRAVLCSSMEVDAPSLLGLGSPRLLLPEWMVPVLSESELQQIALHECEHLRRRDDWMNFLLQAGIMLAPLNPALTWLNRRIALQRELAVDAAVVSRTGDALPYAACLVRLAEQRRERGSVRLALAAWGKKSELVQRVHALLALRSVWTQRQSAWAAGSVAAMLLAFATGIARVPQLIHVKEPIELAADPAPALTVTAPNMRADYVRPSGIAATGQMVRASLQLQPMRTTTSCGKRKLTRAQQGTRALPHARAARAPFKDAPHLLRTAAFLPQTSSVAWARTMRTEEPVRLMTAEFSLPYLAVPMSSGWLLIEL